MSSESKAIDRVAKVADVIARAGDEGQKIRRLTDEGKKVLIDEGFFRFTLPKELGGEDATIRETIDVLAAISAIDASVGWNVMLGSEINAMAAGGMPKDLAKEVYLDNPNVVMCGGGGPGTMPSKAEIQPDGGYKVWGESTFISGCHNSEWCFIIAPVFENGELKMGDNGMPIGRSFFINKDDFEIIDSWDVAGLRGSGSHTVKVDGAYVSPKWAQVELTLLPALYDNPVFRVPVPLRLAYNKSAIAIGVARGALDAFVGLAQNKVPALTISKLKDRPIAQHRLAEMEGKFRAAKAYLYDAMKDVEDELLSGVATPGPETTQNGRLACIHASNACMEVVDEIHRLAGTSASYMENPLERFLRDAHGAASHRWVSHSLYADVGKILMGDLEGGDEFLGEGGPVLGEKRQAPE